MSYQKGACRIFGWAGRYIAVFLITIGLSLSYAFAEYSLSEYRIGPEDVLKIYVWNHPELSLSVPVRIDGKISIPLVNDVDVSGTTPMELKNKITTELAKFIEQPTVSVIVEAINSQKIVIVGNVTTPGVYRIGSVLSLMEAISKAGGLGEWANAKKIKVVQKKGGSEKIIEINYNDLIKGENLKNNILIYPGDKIIVP